MASQVICQTRTTEGGLCLKTPKKRKNKVSDSSDISSPKEPPISLSAMYKQLSSHNTSKASKFYKNTIFFYVTNTDIKMQVNFDR